MTTTTPAELADQIAASDPSSSEEQRSNLELIAGLRNAMPSHARSEAKANLELAATLTGYLVRTGGLGPRDVLDIISTLVKEVDAAMAEATAPTGANARKVELTMPANSGSLSLMGADTAKHNSKLLGEILFRLGTISREQLEQARNIQHATGVRLGEALVTIGATDWDGVTKGLGIQKQITGRS